ncbi:amidase [Geminicoccus roseus]|uniref:amidase n=1 Tax=Geminicoccus roseus TaxID=404900 RepID=UPI0003FED2BA|nr:amidase [Geminicoccus roseus]
MPTVTKDLVELYAGSDATALAGLVRDGQVTPAELVETAIAVIEDLDPKLNAVVIRSFDEARAEAARGGLSGPFAGVPFLLKNIGSQWKGSRLDHGLAYLKDHVCGYDSTLSARIRAAGFLLLGRTNTPEGGWCIGTEPRLYGNTLNPWNPGFTPGGSSGGAAVAVASGMVPLAEGSDGGGSIRVPASCCGLVGLKPSRGRITYGPEDADLWMGSVYTFALTRTVRDTAAYLDAVAGAEPGDPYTPPTPQQSWLSLLAEAPKPLRIGFAQDAPFGPALAPPVAEAVADTARLLEAMGHRIEPYRLRCDLERAWWDYNDVVAVETAAEFDRLAAIVGRPVEEHELAPFNWSMLRHGRGMAATRYAAALAGIRKASQLLGRELHAFDVFLTPTLTQPPRPVGYWSMEDGDRERYLARWSDAAFMFAFNISGLPAMSLPSTRLANGVPIGVQLVGRLGDEATLLNLAGQIEQARPWAEMRPPIRAGA